MLNEYFKAYKENITRKINIRKNCITIRTFYRVVNHSESF